MMCDTSRLYIGDDNAIELVGLHDIDVEGMPPITNAAVTVVGVDSNDVRIPGLTWPMTLTYNAEKDLYEGNLPSTAEMTEDELYTFIFSVIVDNKTSTFSATRYAEYRGQL